VVDDSFEYSKPMIVALQWSATLVEPLLSLNQRIEIEGRFRILAVERPEYFKNYTAGVVGGLVSALPFLDPWRKTKIDDDGEAKWLDGLPFGSRNDVNDLRAPVPALDHLGIDPATVAIEDLSATAAQVLVQAFHGWKAARRQIDIISDRRSQDMCFEDITAAIRRAAHRHRSYRPSQFDNWLEYLVVEWAQLAEEVADQPFDDEILERDIVREREKLTAIARDRFLAL
jgi:hypothetical protein